jgi:hypothetical protein
MDTSRGVEEEGEEGQEVDDNRTRRIVGKGGYLLWRSSNQWGERIPSMGYQRGKNHSIIVSFLLILSLEVEVWELFEWGDLLMG